MEKITIGGHELQLTPAIEYQVILAAFQLLFERSKDRGEYLKDPASAGRLIQLRIARAEREIFTVIYLDSRHRVIEIEDLFFGTIDGAEVHPREVVKGALLKNAAALIVGHNHPSGSAEPSAADRAVTARLKQALALVDVRLLDHFVVTTDGQPVSMAARGWV